MSNLEFECCIERNAVGLHELKTDSKNRRLQSRIKLKDWFQPHAEQIQLSMP